MIFPDQCCGNCLYFTALNGGPSEIGHVFHQPTIPEAQATGRILVTASCRRFPKMEIKDYLDWCGEFKTRLGSQSPESTAEKTTP